MPPLSLDWKPKPSKEKIRENVGLQDIGLLVLDSENGSVKRDAWTLNFQKMIFALDFPKLVDKSPHRATAGAAAGCGRSHS